jgi:hypothetical protein
MRNKKSKRRKQVTLGQQARMVKLYRRGVRVQELARSFDREPATVRHALGSELKRRREPSTAENLAEVIAQVFPNGLPFGERCDAKVAAGVAAHMSKEFGWPVTQKLETQVLAALVSLRAKSAPANGEFVH